MDIIQRQHSGPGIASFVIGSLALLGLAMFEAANRLGAGHAPASGISIMSVLLNALPILVILPLALLALGLGIGGLCQSGRRKEFAIAGLALSVTVPVLFVTWLLWAP